jgi:hypothetical protein
MGAVWCSCGAMPGEQHAALCLTRAGKPAPAIGTARTVETSELRPGLVDAGPIIGRTTTRTELEAPGYDTLASVLIRAFRQAAEGKGAQRHAQGQPFDQQPMQQLIRLYGIGFALGQAAKKAQEAQRLPTVDRQVAELLGAINYLAGAVIALEAGQSTTTTKE